MEKKNYYVSVQSGTIVEGNHQFTNDFEIIAEQHEIERLQQLFSQREQVEVASSFRSIIPGMPYHYDEENDQYDAVMTNIYEQIHLLGTETTKSHIENMNILH